ncbi:MAG: diacylglycerol kinase family protein [Candidatus Melainabacteria bacterium]|nr:diacylglycerol kinase family protein [Candidatus Melainabacteria bacterium]
MSDPSPEAKRKERLARAKSRNVASLQERRQAAKLDVVPQALVPASWQRKSGRAGNLVESFYHAFHGVAIGLRDQRNLRIHFCLCVAVTIAGVAWKIDMMSWLALIIVMSLVIACEFINTSLEHLVDISTNNQYHYAARCAKDTAAAAVLSVSFAAAIVGMLVFGPKVLALFS